MEKNLFEKRKTYQKFDLLEENLKKNPMELFSKWYSQAEKNEIFSEVNAMVLSTVENSKVPRSRTVLLKKYTWEGFYFFTNYQSRKAKSIKINPEVCLYFHWENSERQVIIQAIAEKIIDDLSDRYFCHRPRGSQLSAIISPQSREIPDRNFLEQKYITREEQLKIQPTLKRPNYWGGYFAKPYEIEFWQGRPNRLHDRIIYSLRKDFSWKIKRLAP